MIVPGNLNKNQSLTLHQPGACFAELKNVGLTSSSRVEALSCAQSATALALGAYGMSPSTTVAAPCSTCGCNPPQCKQRAMVNVQPQCETEAFDSGSGWVGARPQDARLKQLRGGVLQRGCAVLLGEAQLPIL